METTWIDIANEALMAAELFGAIALFIWWRKGENE